MACETSYPPSRFNAVKLRKWVDENKFHLVECETCETTPVEGPPVPCNLCKKTKARSEFAVARRQSNQLKKWRCRACDYAPCHECGKIPDKVLHIAGRTETKWTCQACLYPPCAGCNKERTKRAEYNKHNLPVYWCGGCVKKGLGATCKTGSGETTKRSKK